MPSTLEKTRKKIMKKRGALGALHEGSRDSRRLHKALVRDERLEKLAMLRRKHEQPLVERAGHFQQIVLERDNKVLAGDEIDAGIKSFLRRHDEEIEAAKQARRPGRPQTKREDVLKVKIASLEKEFQNGFLIPDLTDEDNVAMLSRWEGSWSQLNCLKWVRITSDGTFRVASFPPKD
ncbi:hypothetical protein CMQ_1351 [Grosmannia clavigera kw1407]|uniref:Translation machinery-associated protein 16 n=1 Tax=Grosmannia clavigera (strain kw1407 / UAMH 11150) TaxID=655863 RepID=F0XEI7_GROCL|nr:uncharacterized protein CMQ_1351 [Grosmannia clavigera kw1407]EFX04423.1 hypothetical protein CMQ_1351 [Grosmannia clavigera kw1407]